MVLPGVAAAAGVALDATMGQMIKAMDSLKSTIVDSIAFADNAQKASLALGQTYKDTNDSLGPTMENLRGDMNERFAAAIVGLEVGLQGSTQGIARLVNQQRLTGTQSANTAKAFAGLEATLGLSREETNKLAASLVVTGEEWQISTDNLVGAIDSLKATFPAQALAGMGDKVQGAMVQLQAELGPQLAGPLSNVMKMVMDTSMEGYEKLTMLGIGDVRERLSASQNATEAQEILKNAMVTASDNFKNVAGNAEEGFFQIGIATELFGQQAINFTTVADNFGVRVKREAEESDKFADSLEVLRSEILQPFAKAVAENVFPILLKLVPFFQKAIIAVVRGLRIGLNLLDPAWKWLKKSIKEISDMFTFNSDNIKTAIHWGIVVPVESVKFVFGGLKAGVGVLLLGLMKLAEGIARVIEKISSFFGGSLEVNEDRVKKMQDFALAMIESGGDTARSSWDRITMDSEKSGDKALKDLSDSSKMGNQLLGGIDEGMIKNFAALGKIEKNTKNIDDKTPELVISRPKFLDETAVMLGESIERILGVGGDTTPEESLEEQKTQTSLLAGILNTAGGVGTPILTEME